MSAVEQTAAQAAAGASAAASVLAAVQDWALAMFGVPLAVVFGALAGTCYGVTFNPTATWGKLAASASVTTAMGAYVAPLALSYFMPDAPTLALSGSAAIVGFLLQYGGPWLKANRERIMERIFSIFGGSK